MNETNNNNMKASELKMTPVTWNMSVVRYPKGAHIRSRTKDGHWFPTTKAQLKRFKRLDVLNSKDVQDIESIMNLHGMKGKYKYTKSEQWVRLQNFDDLIHCLKKEFTNL